MCLPFPLKKIPPRADVTRRTRRAVQLNTEEERLCESGAFIKMKFKITNSNYPPSMRWRAFIETSEGGIGRRGCYGPTKEAAAMRLNSLIEQGKIRAERRDKAEQFVAGLGI